jgi:hypothetical protein
MAEDDGEVDAAIAALTRDIEETVVEFVTEVVALLQEETPFLTGHARANWIPSIGQPYAAIVQAGTQAAGLAEILGYRIAQGDVFVTNNVPYIGRLNRGWSKQAPAEFVESCVARAIQTVNARPRE